MQPGAHSSNPPLRSRWGEVGHMNFQFLRVRGLLKGGGAGTGIGGGARGLWGAAQFGSMPPGALATEGRCFFLA